MANPPVIPVIGSDIFASRPLGLDELRARISPSLRLHSIEDENVEINPLTYEVLRHRIWSITDEMGETLKKMSGSPGVTEANDFDFAICDELGQEVQVGLYNTGLVASIDYAIQWTLQNRSENPGIEPGDMFLMNDPWVGGGLHQNDVAIIAPLFIEDELFGWTASTCHIIDVGGAKPGSADMAAYDIFTEAVPTPPIKVVRGGQIQLDVVQSFIRRSRAPILANLDINAEIGANRVGHSRLRKLVSAYGAATVKAVMRRMMDDAEARLRDRLRSIPDGSWESSGYLECSVVGDRELKKIQLKLTKQDDKLLFDFTGTDPQSGAVNCPYTGMRAGVMFALLPILAGDIPWCPGGLMRPLEFISEAGTLNNATFPAAVGTAPLSAAWETSNVVTELFGRMMNASPSLTPRVQSGCTGAFDMVTLAGLDQRGVPAVTILFDTMAGGYGAKPGRDGADAAGVAPIPMGRAPDVEMTEFLSPCLYLWRREEADSGGAGANRGGLSISICLVPHKTPVPMIASFSGNGKGRPAVPGLAGGYPGGPQQDIIIRGADVGPTLAGGTIPGSLDQIAGTRELVPARHETMITSNDAIYIHPSGGGGYGDPLHRDPAKVAADVRDGRVTGEAAQQLYGVVLDTDGTVAAAETAATRATIRRDRLGHEPLRLKFDSAALQAPHLDTNLTAVGGNVRCVHCGTVVGPPDRLYDEMQAATVSLAGELTGVSIGSRHYTDADVALSRWFCPGCGTAVRTVVTASAVPSG